MTPRRESFRQVRKVLRRGDMVRPVALIDEEDSHNSSLKLISRMRESSR